MVNVAQVGCGYWGKNLARNFSEIGHLAAVSDECDDVARRFSELYDVPARTFDEILVDDEIDAIALATPAALHSVQAARAIGAGKHCFVEKPLALDVTEAEKLIELANDRKRVLMIGHLLQYHPIFLKCVDLVGSGSLGTLRYLYSNRLSLGKIRTEEDVMWSFGPHDISMVLALAGESPSRVSAQGMAHVTPGIIDWCTLQMQFPSGLRGHVHTSWLHPFKEQRLVVIGDKAMLVFEDSEPDWSRKLALYPYRLERSNLSAPVPIKEEAVYIDVAKSEPLKDQCWHFVRSIESGTEPRTCGREGLDVLGVLAAAEVALRDVSVAGAELA